MNAKRYVRNQVAYRLINAMPLTEDGIHRIVKALEARYGVGLAKLDAKAMTQTERNDAINAIIRVTRARHDLGLKPFRPIEPNEDPESDILPVPYMSNDEITALHAMVEATAKDEGWFPTSTGA